MGVKKGRFYKDYFLLGELEDNELVLIEKILRQEEGIESLKNVITESASEFGRKSDNIVLREPQTTPVAMSWVNKRLFIGDKPGLGKTVISTGAYAFYRMKMKELGNKVGKLLLITDNNHVLGMTKEMREKFGVNLVPLIDGTDRISRKVSTFDLEDESIDGVATSWGSVKTNGFLYFYLNNMDYFDMAILDETSALINPNNQVSKVVDNMLNKVGGGIERVLFLNGSSFEKSIYDLYNQFKVLSPKLFPSKKFIDEHYVIKGGRSWWETEMVMLEGKAEFVKKEVKTGEIIDYKNQEDLKKRIRHHYIARSKSDYSKYIPKYNYLLHVSELTNKQKKWLDDAEIVNASVLNSPSTSDPDAKFNEKTVPKLKDVLDFYEQVVDDRPIIYVYNRASQLKMKEMLLKRGYESEILNGGLSSEEKQDLIDKFNEGEVDCLIFNIAKAVNIPTSDRIIFYDIPTMPQLTYQIKGRIDRDNYVDPKMYDFFVYLDSPEMGNIIRLAYFREKHASLFTGQEEDVYKQLIYQLKKYYDMSQLDRIGDLMRDIEDEFSEVTFEDVDEEFENLFK